MLACWLILLVNVSPWEEVENGFIEIVDNKKPLLKIVAEN